MNKPSRKHRNSVQYKRMMRQIGLFLLFLLFSIGILAVNRGDAAVRKLAVVLDPVYACLMKECELIGYAHEKESISETDKKDGFFMEGENDQEVIRFLPEIHVNGDVQIIYGDGYPEELEVSASSLSSGLMKNRQILSELYQTKSYQYLIQNFYIVNPTTYVSEDLFPVEDMLNMDFSFAKDATQPQILIHHTHASETYIDSREEHSEDTVVALGTELAGILSKNYGYQVIHDKTVYDQIDGKLDRNLAYEKAEEGTKQILEEYPGIQVIIDLHRDAGAKRVAWINGKNTAQVMFFNGLSRNMNGPIAYLYNPYQKENLAFSLQCKLKAMEHWADFAKPIFLKGYEYNLGMMPRSLLIEVGTNENTLEEAVNAMEPLAQILVEVLEMKEAS